MSQDEQKEYNHLQNQLTAANSEARLYRGLFWCLLALAAGATVLHILQQ